MHLLILMVAINISPKLSKDHDPASMSVFEVVLGVFQVDLPHNPAPHPKPKVEITGPIIT